MSKRSSIQSRKAQHPGRQSFPATRTVLISCSVRVPARTRRQERVYYSKRSEKLGRTVSSALGGMCCPRLLISSQTGLCPFRCNERTIMCSLQGLSHLLLLQAEDRISHLCHEPTQHRLRQRRRHDLPNAPRVVSFCHPRDAKYEHISYLVDKHDFQS